MSWKCDVIGETGLQFYGKIVASLTHEIKNALAVINENAGLLKDFTLMSKEGVPIDPERLRSVSEKVMKQVQRADGIVGNMNRFAHSVDESLKEVDLAELLAFVATLSGRLASMRGVSLEPRGTEGPVTITTNPFFLQNLVSLCLDFAMDAADEKKTVGLSAEKREDGAQIRFTGVGGLAEAPTNAFPASREKKLLDALSAQLAVDTESGEFLITLSKDMH
jgi:signal transduction histidine kinase